MTEYPTFNEAELWANFKSYPDHENMITEMIEMIKEHDLDISNPDALEALLFLWGSVKKGRNVASPHLRIEDFELLFRTNNRDKITRILTEKFHIPESQIRTDQFMENPGIYEGSVIIENEKKGVVAKVWKLLRYITHA